MASHPGYTASRGPGGLRPRTPIVVAGVMALAAILVLAAMLVVVRPVRHAGPAPGSGATATAPATTTTGPITTAPPATQPNAAPTAPTALAGFGSAPVLGGSPASGPVTSGIVSVRAAAHDGYDRFVVDLGSSPLQQYEVRPQATPAFTLDPKGEAVTLQGGGGVLVVLRGASNHAAFTGPTDLRPGLPAIREARLTGDFEGVVSWALGVDGPGFIRVQALASPSRLVVDVQQS